MVYFSVIWQTEIRLTGVWVPLNDWGNLKQIINFVIYPVTMPKNHTGEGIVADGMNHVIV